MPDLKEKMGSGPGTHDSIRPWPDTMSGNVVMHRRWDEAGTTIRKDVFILGAEPTLQDNNNISKWSTAILKAQR